MAGIWKRVIFQHFSWSWKKSLFIENVEKKVVTNPLWLVQLLFLIIYCIKIEKKLVREVCSKKKILPVSWHKNCDGLADLLIYALHIYLYRVRGVWVSRISISQCAKCVLRALSVQSTCFAQCALRMQESHTLRTLNRVEHCALTRRAPGSCRSWIVFTLEETHFYSIFQKRIKYRNGKLLNEVILR